MRNQLIPTWARALARRQAIGIAVLCGLTIVCALAPAPASAAVTGSTPLGQALNVVNGWRNDAQLWLPVMCVLSWVATAITLALEGFRLNAALIAFGSAALGSTFVLAGPAFITALATLFGYSGALI